MVRGVFIHAKEKANFVFNKMIMKSILSTWYEDEAYRHTKEEANNRLTEVLEAAEK